MRLDQSLSVLSTAQSELRMNILTAVESGSTPLIEEILAKIDPMVPKWVTNEARAWAYGYSRGYGISAEKSNPDRLYWQIRLDQFKDSVSESLSEAAKKQLSLKAVTNLINEECGRLPKRAPEWVRTQARMFARGYSEALENQFTEFLYLVDGKHYAVSHRAKTVGLPSIEMLPYEVYRNLSGKGSIYWVDGEGKGEVGNLYFRGSN